MSTEQKIKDAIKEFIQTGMSDAETFRQRYNETMTELDSFVRGEQWTLSGRKETNKGWHNKPVTNYSHVIATRKTSDVTYDDITPKLRPQKADQQEVVEKLEKVIQNVWKNVRMHHYVNDAVKHSRIFPYGITKLLFNKDKIIGTENNLVKGEIKARTVDPLNFFWDPRGFELKDCRYVYETSRVTWQDLESETNFDKKIIKELKESENSDETGTQRIGETLDNRDYTTGQDKTIILKEVYLKYNVNASTTKIAKLFMVDGKILFQKNNIGTMFPYSKIVEFDQPHEFAGKSSVMLTLDNQKYINKVDGIVANLATQHQNPQKIVSKDSGLTPAEVAKFGDAPGAVYGVDGDPNSAIATVKPNSIDPSLIRLVDSKKQDMLFVSNISQVQLGEAPGSVSTAGGIGSLLSQSSQKDSDSKIQYEKYILRLVEIIITYIKQHKSMVEYRIDSTNPDDEMEYTFEQISASDFKDIAHDIVIDVPMSQTEKQQQKQEVMTLLSLGAQTGKTYIDAKDAIAMMGFPDTNRLIANMHKREEQQRKQKEVQVATVAAALALQSIANAPESASKQEIVQSAVVEALQQVDPEVAKELTGDESGGNGGTGVAAGMAAPQNKGIA